MIAQHSEQVFRFRSSRIFGIFVFHYYKINKLTIYFSPNRIIKINRTGKEIKKIKREKANEDKKPSIK